MYTKLLPALLTGAILISCNTGSKKAPAAKASVTQARDNVIATKKAFANISFDSKKDLVCGMPVTAAIEDTCHYKGKVYAFCSKECRAAFVKEPVLYIGKK